MIRSFCSWHRNLAAAALLLGAVPAAAGDAGGDAGGGGFALQVGGFAVVAPKYEGSSEYELQGIPIVAPGGYGMSDGGTVQFRGPDDLRFRLLNVSGFEAGPLIGWRFGREQDDADRLQGLGDVDGGFVAGAYAGYRWGGFMPYVSYHHQLSGDDTGGVVRFGAEAKTSVAHGVTVTATGGATWADDDYMGSYFSVTGAQSLASAADLAAYDAEAGIKDVFFGLSTDVPVGERWSLKLSGRYARLLDDAADSPIVEDENQLFGGIGLTYRFSFDR